MPEADTFTGTGISDGLPTISWDEACHQARIQYGMIPYEEIGDMLRAEGWGFARLLNLYVRYGKAID